jgi:hypothetical protein
MAVPSMTLAPSDMAILLDRKKVGVEEEKDRRARDVTCGLEGEGDE